MATHKISPHVYLLRRREKTHPSLHAAVLVVVSSLSRCVVLMMFILVDVFRWKFWVLQWFELELQLLLELENSSDTRIRSNCPKILRSFASCSFIWVMLLIRQSTESTTLSLVVADTNEESKNRAAGKLSEWEQQRTTEPSPLQRLTRYAQIHDCLVTSIIHMYIIKKKLVCLSSRKLRLSWARVFAAVYIIESHKKRRKMESASTAVVGRNSENTRISRLHHVVRRILVWNKHP